MHSHHSHSGQFCRHAKGDLEEIVKEAIKQGFETYGLSEHIPRYDVRDLYPEEEGISPEELSTTFDAYIAEATRLKKVYSSQITLLVGLETECIRPEHDLPALTSLISRHGAAIDYIVGSLHHVKTIPIDFSEELFEQAVATCGSMRQYILEYLRVQHQLLESIKPEIIGHFDLCRLYRPRYRLEEDAEIWSAVKRNVDLAISYGALFEANAAALRKGWNTAYPGEEILALVSSLGGRICLSDDAHSLVAVGNHYRELKAYLESMGLRKLWRLVPQADGKRARAVRIENWIEHPFWRSLEVQADS